VEWLRAHNIMDYSLLIGVGMVRSRTTSSTGTTNSPSTPQQVAAAEEADPSLEEEDISWSHLSPSCYNEWVRDTGGLRARDNNEEEKGIV
jgi:hypothetical protein